jgi:hypothetical protein
MSDLIEHILNEDYVSASRVFESKIDNIIESKLYEMKKMVQAEAIGLHGQHYMSNADWAKYRKKKGPNLGPLDTPTKKGGKRSETGLEQRKRLGFVKASKVLPDPRDRNLDEMIGLPIIPPEKESEYQKKAKKSQKKAQATAAVSDDDFAKHAANAAGEGPSNPKPETPETPATPKYQRPGMLKRNFNTLLGREPGHVDDRTPEEKLKQKGGRVGWALRKTWKALGTDISG